MFIIIILILSIVLAFLLCSKEYCQPDICDKEDYSRGFPPLITSNFQNYYKVITPLKPLLSPIKSFEAGLKLPDIYIYNPKYFSSVRDQGRCGGCWAFVICSMLSDNVTTKVLKFGKDLNVQQVLSCYPEVNPCLGAAPEDALLWLEKTNFKISIDTEYLQSVSKCLKTEKGISVSKGTVKSLCKYIQRESIRGVPTQDEQKLLTENIYNMKMQLLKNGPFFGSLNIYENFFNFPGDTIYIKGPGESVGGHAIEIVGWVDKGVDVRDGFENGYWVCKNSWGNGWAPKYDFFGHFAIQMGTNECGIESRSGCAETNVDYILESEQIPEFLVINKYTDLIKHYLEKRKKSSF